MEDKKVTVDIQVSDCRSPYDSERCLKGYVSRSLPEGGGANTTKGAMKAVLPQEMLYDWGRDHITYIVGMGEL